MDNDFLPLDATPSRLERWLESGRLVALNPVLASRLSRDDLGGSYAPPAISDPYSNPQIAVGGASSAAGAVAGLDTGRISVAMIGVLVLLGAGFYIWTRRFQS